MKNLKQGAIISIFLLSTILMFGQKEQLTIAGFLISQKEVVTNEKVLVYEGDNAVASTITNNVGFFQISLEYDKLYHIVIGSVRYKMKWVAVSTYIPVDERDIHLTNLYINIDPRKENTEYAIVK